MLRTIELAAPRTLDMIKPSGRSIETDRQRQLLAGYLYGPAGREFYRGIRDGSVDLNDLPSFREAIDQHFFERVGRIHSIPESIGGSQMSYMLHQETAMTVVREIVRKAFPHLERKLGQFKNEVKLKAPSPTTLFKVLALPEDQVDRREAFEIERQLMIVDTAIPLDVRSKSAEVSQKAADWNDIFNTELFEPPYGAGEEYQLDVYHDDKTNAVKRFHSANIPFDPPKEGEHLAVHDFVARRVKGYGLVYADVNEEDVVSATIKALVKAANNGGVIRPVEDVKSSITMTFVDLEDKPQGCQGPNSRIGHLTVLRRKVWEVMNSRMNIANVNGKVRGGLELWLRESPEVPIRLEFFNRRDYLDSIYHVGFKARVKGIPEPVYNGKAEELADLRSYYPLLPHLFPPEIYGRKTDIQAVLLGTMDEVAARLKRDCTAQTTSLYPEDIEALLR